MDIKKVEKISKALGDPYRLKIMGMVKQQSTMQCACIVDNIDLAQSTISHHINLLVDADLLIADKDGRNYKYQINQPVFSEYIQFLAAFEGK
ncbi:metalloregulator ArsR/SmtB family transcription factor [Mucilaginibacter sp. HMF5004]|uniref:ArsR/SmtB family transcription factor n=1 Tax=Mucilaginibacter rivuli TaxID=2857527 RepID=UPI001C5EF37E|nr:metalloregulator ArsR/SmtB family transcription factor [Mucilaginibacter rivuli]MBW4888559.1 metalloregulator ArsR/SmtB family transcription factor [Mucilaginibacter rivuli]